MAEGLSNQERLLLLEEAQATLSPQDFSKLVATAATVPIAEQVLEDTVVRRVFPTDTFSEGPALPYTLKKRHASAVVTPRYGATPTYIPRYERILVEPYVISLKTELSVIDIMDANFNMVMDNLEDAGHAMAEKEDKDMIRQLQAAAPLPAGAWPANTDVVTVEEAPGGLGKRLNKNVIRIGSSAAAPDGGAAGDPALKDLIMSQTLLRSIGYSSSTQLVNPWTIGKFMVQTAFNEVYKFGSNTVHATGDLTGMLGDTIIWSNLIDQGDIFVLDPNETGRWVERKPLEIIPNTKELVEEWLLWERACPFIRNANALIRVRYQV